MAAAASASRSQDRTSKRRPFAWMKRLTNLKGSSDSNGQLSRKSNTDSNSKSQKSAGHSVKFPATAYANVSATSSQRDQPRHVPNGGSYFTQDGEDGQIGPDSSSKSTAPTVATNPGTIHSDTGQSKTGTSNTVGGRLSSNDGGENSIFTSSNHSARSLTTTLTTIQSTAPSQFLNNAALPAGNTPQSTTFSHQHQPSIASTHTSPPPSAIPPHLVHPGSTSGSASYQPNTYASATANNILTDNASVLTLASSSKRHGRRDSIDTGASVRALAPSSAWGGSRESLPLSVLSGVGTIDSSAPPTASGPGPGPGSISGSTFHASQTQRPSYGGLANDQRTSYYSTTGSSAYNPQKERFADGSSVRSGLLGHGRNDSMAGSTAGVVVAPTSPLATSPREAAAPGGRLPSRRSSEGMGMPESMAEKEQREDAEQDEADEAASRGTRETGDDAAKDPPLPANGDVDLSIGRLLP